MSRGKYIYVFSLLRPSILRFLLVVGIMYSRYHEYENLGVCTLPILTV